MPDLRKARAKKGFSKVVETCRLAREQGLGYAWIDTCCIDKSSSAELTEAINSMFNWYKEASICFAFLSDLPGSGGNSEDQLQRCRWFTRGWTLQELIAPKIVEFYDQGWQRRGTKKSLQQELSAITGIDLKILKDSNLLSTIPVARRMSWASNRKTSRVEDRAYSLLGIFDVNVPLIYGEGPKAFIRLQEEIMKQSNDLSLVRCPFLSPLFRRSSISMILLPIFPLKLPQGHIVLIFAQFAWTAQDNTQEFHGCLASSVSEFQGCGSLRRGNDYDIDFEATNRGIRFSAKLYRFRENDTRANNFVDLSYNYGDAYKPIALCLASTVHGYARYSAETIVLMPSYLKLKRVPGTFHIRKTISKTESNLLTMQNAHRFTVRIDNRTTWLSVKEDRPYAMEHFQSWDAASNAFHTLLGENDFQGRLLISLFSENNGKDILESEYCQFLIALGLKADENAVEPGTEPRALTPWATLCHRYYDRRNFLRGFTDDRWSQVESGHTIFNNDFRTPLPTFCKIDRDAFPESFSRDKPSFTCSVSTNVDTKRESGMYELVFCIEDSVSYISET